MAPLNVPSAEDPPCSFLLRAAPLLGLLSRLSLPQSAALGRQARPSVPFFDFGCWAGRRARGRGEEVDQGAGA